MNELRYQKNNIKMSIIDGIYVVYDEKLKKEIVRHKATPEDLTSLQELAHAAFKELGLQFEEPEEPSEPLEVRTRTLSKLEETIIVAFILVIGILIGLILAPHVL